MRLEGAIILGMRQGDKHTVALRRRKVRRSHSGCRINGLPVRWRDLAVIMRIGSIIRYPQA